MRGFLGVNPIWIPVNKHLLLTESLMGISGSYQGLFRPFWAFKILSRAAQSHFAFRFECITDLLKVHLVFLSKEVVLVSNLLKPTRPNNNILTFPVYFKTRLYDQLTCSVLLLQYFVDIFEYVFEILENRGQPSMMLHACHLPTLKSLRQEIKSWRPR
jgi:hypothetical protein